MQRPARSLKSRALQLLAQRDQSRLELRRKLLRHARAARAESRIDGDADGGDARDATNAAALEVDTLLDWLEANGFLSEARFAESRVHARESRFGLLRIRNELAQHDLALPADLEERLAASELDRAAAVRARRFHGPPRDAAERARQSRFLLARGFAPELVHRLMRGLGRPTVESDSSPADTR